MFYYNGESWLPFKKKISYTETIVVYDNDSAPHQGKENLEVEEIELTNSQLYRLEAIKNAGNLSIQEVENYVFNKETGSDVPSVIDDSIKTFNENQAIKELVDFDSAPAEVLDKMDFLKKEFKDGVFIMKNDLVEFEGGLYLSLQDHVADENYPPDKTNYRYVVKRKGTHGDGDEPDLWVQPTGYENVYNKGDRVKYFDGFIYVSKIDGNSQEPTKDEPYNRWWKLDEN